MSTARRSVAALSNNTIAATRMILDQKFITAENDPGECNASPSTLHPADGCITNQSSRVPPMHISGQDRCRRELGHLTCFSMEGCPLLGVQEVPGSNPGRPDQRDLPFFSPSSVSARHRVAHRHPLSPAGPFVFPNNLNRRRAFPSAARAIASIVCPHPASGCRQSVDAFAHSALVRTIHRRKGHVKQAIQCSGSVVPPLPEEAIRPTLASLPTKLDQNVFGLLMCTSMAGGNASFAQLLACQATFGSAAPRSADVVSLKGGIAILPLMRVKLFPSAR